MNFTELKLKKKKISAMHISVRHDMFYKFPIGVINVENKEKRPVFVAHFRKVFRSRPLPPFDLCPTFCTKRKAL